MWLLNWPADHQCKVRAQREAPSASPWDQHAVPTPCVTYLPVTDTSQITWPQRQSLASQPGSGTQAKRALGPSQSPDVCVIQHTGQSMSSGIEYAPPRPPEVRHLLCSRGSRCSHLYVTLAAKTQDSRPPKKFADFRRTSQWL